jgi:hypothetical protein
MINIVDVSFVFAVRIVKFLPPLAIASIFCLVIGLVYGTSIDFFRHGYRSF